MPIGAKGLTGFRSNKGIGLAGRTLMASRRLIATWRTIPQQIECRSLIVGLEQIGTDRLSQGGAVKVQRNVVTGLLAVAFLARANFWADR